MDIALVIFWLFAGVSILYVMHFGLYLVGANFYDVWQQRRKGIAGVRLPVRVRAGVRGDGHLDPPCPP